MFRQVIFQAIAYASVIPLSHAAGEVGKPDDEAAKLVHEGLTAGLGGDADLRRRKLEAAIAKAPNSQAAHWHLGHVRVKGEWKTVAQAESLARNDEKLATYRNLRAMWAGSAAGEARLASWCQRNGLPVQSRTHWLQVLRYDRQNKAAIRALDAVWYRGNLAPRSHAARRRELDDQLREEMKSLIPRLREMRSAVVEGDDRATETAVRELGEMRGDLAVIAISEVLLKPTKDASLTTSLHGKAMELLADLESPESLRILAWHATHSPFSLVQQAARQHLENKPVHQRVPVLLAGLQMPIDVSVSTRAVGRQTTTTLSFSREGPADREMRGQHTFYRNIGGTPTLAFDHVTRAWKENPIIFL